MNPQLRDILCFVGGCAGMFHQTAIADSAQTILVAAFVGMILGPVFLLPLVRRFTGNGNGNGKADNHDA